MLTSNSQQVIKVQIEPSKPNLDDNSVAGGFCETSSRQAKGPFQSVSEVLPFAIVFLAACLIFFGFLGTFPLFNPDEALYAEPAREMLDTGEYITTLLNYVVRYTKPPLVIWAMALSYKTFGVSEFAARFPVALSGVLLVASVYLFLWRYTDKKTAALASLTLISAPLFVGTGREAIVDMPLSLFMGIGLMSFYHAFKSKKSGFYFLAYAMVGLAVMTKGPVAIVLPVAILGLYHLLKGNLRQAAKEYKPIWGIGLILAIALPWFATEIIITKGAYFREFIIRENFQRYTSVVDSHKGGWWYHLACMFGGFFPWSLFLPQALFKACFPVQLPAGSIKTKIKTWFSGLAKLQGQADLRLYATIWAAVTLVFFSTSVSKLLTYTVPAFAALAILVSTEIIANLTKTGCFGPSRDTSELEKRNAYVSLLVPFAVLAITYGLAGLVGPLALKKLRQAPPELFAIASNYISVQCLVSFATIVLLARRYMKAAVAVFTVSTLISSALFGIRALTSISSHWEGPLPGLAQYCALTGEPIFVFDLRKPSVPFYSHCQVIEPGSQEDIAQRLPSIPRAYIITKPRGRDFLLKMPGSKLVVEQGPFVLMHWSRPEVNFISDKEDAVELTPKP